MYLKDFVLNFHNCIVFMSQKPLIFLMYKQISKHIFLNILAVIWRFLVHYFKARMAFNIHFLAFILLAVSLKTRLHVELLTSFHHFLFARFGCTLSAAVACNHCCSSVNFLHLMKIRLLLDQGHQKPLRFSSRNLIIIILTGDIQVNPGPTSIYSVNCLLPGITKEQYAVIIVSYGTIPIA